MNKALLFLLLLVSVTACKRKEKKGEDKVYLQYKQYEQIAKNYGLTPIDSTKLALDEYIKIFPTDARAHAFLGRLFYDLKQNDQALAAYQKAINLNPQMAEGYSGAGAIFGLLEQSDSAIYYLQEALAHRDSSAYTFMNLSLQYSKSQLNKNTALALVDSALQKTPTAPVYAGLSFVLKKLGDKERSESLFQQAKDAGLKDTIGFVDVLKGQQKLTDFYTKNNY